MIPSHIVDQILSTARVEEVIGDYVSLKRSGSNLKGMSPFTEEKTASFMVSPARQIWKCFSSGKGGNAVSFMMEVEHYSYPEALRHLANRYNIEIPAQQELTPEERQQQTELESLSICNAFAADVFEDNLHEDQEGKAIGLSYFKKRGFSTETIKAFMLGYSLNKFDDILNKSEAKGYNKAYFEKLGLIKTKGDKSFDFFRGRVMFPILSISGKVLGFGGRTLTTDKKIAKYFNSPESPIYNKSKILYGLFQSKGEIIKNDQCYLVEGYTDVISLHQAGVKNVVASSGTALTKDQIQLIKRYTKNICILYDGDAAGIRASFRGINLILEADMNVKVVLFPEGEDPDSFAQNNSNEALELYLKEKRQDFIHFKSQVLLEEAQNDPIKKAELIKSVIESISIIPDSIKRNVFVKETTNLFDIEERTVIGELNKFLRKQKGLPELAPRPEEKKAVQANNQAKKSSKSPHQEHIELMEKDLIRILLSYGKYSLPFEDEKGENTDVSVVEVILQDLDKDGVEFKIPIHKKIVEILREGLENDTLYEGTYLINHHPGEVAEFVINLTSFGNELSAGWYDKHYIYTTTEKDNLYEAVMGSLYSMKIGHIKDRVKTIEDQLQQPDLPVEQMMLLLKEKQQLDGVRAQFMINKGRTM